MLKWLNIVTEAEGEPAAVLIRGLQLPSLHLNGPGKLCNYLGITRAHNGIDLINNSTFYVTDNAPIPHYLTTTRIGIKKAQDKLWRFVSAATS